MAGRPSWDERFLRGLLKHDPNVDLIAFFILRTPTDLELVPSDELSLIPFPTEELFQEQLRSFDLVFLQNFNYGPYGIGAYLGEIRRYVEEGGGLAMIGGDLSFSSGGYAGTPVADVLPVELLPERGRCPTAAAASRPPTAPFQPAAHRRGARPPAHRAQARRARRTARAGPSCPSSTAPTWSRAPARARRCSACTRRSKDADGKPLPVLTVGEAGKGRVLALTSDARGAGASPTGPATTAAAPISASGRRRSAG